MTEVLLPPAGRAEFIVAAPAAGHTAELVAFPYETNADSDEQQAKKRRPCQYRMSSSPDRYAAPSDNHGGRDKSFDRFRCELLERRLRLVQVVNRESG